MNNRKLERTSLRCVFGTFFRSLKHHMSSNYKLKNINGKMLNSNIITQNKNQKSLLLFEGDSNLAKALEKTINAIKSKQDPASPTEANKLIKRPGSPKGSSENDIKDVHNLEDKIVSNLPKSNIVKRYNESRKIRHADMLSELYLTLDFFGNETKDGLQYVFQHLSNSINDNHREINEMIKSLKCEEAFQNDTDIQNLWKCIDVKYEENKIWLEEFCFTLVKQETFKLYKVQELLWKVSKKLITVGHWTQNEVYDYIFNLAMELQKLSLNNQKYFSILKWTLITHDVNLKIEHFVTWNGFWKKWLMDVKTLALNQFKASIKALSEGQYGYIKDLIIKFRYDCSVKVKQRLTLLNTIRTIKPPNCSMDNVRIWTESHKNLNDAHENICSSFGQEIRKDNPDLQKQLREDLNSIKQSLIKRNVCAEHTVNQILGDDDLQLMDNYLIYLNLTIEKHRRQKQYEKDGLDGLEKFTTEAVEKAVELWEVHQTALNNLNANADCKINKIFDTMEKSTNYEESQLGILLDRLRQTGREETLLIALQAVKDQLSKIEEQYKTYTNKRIKVMTELPILILEEINRYRVDLKNYFGLAAGYLLEPITELPKQDAITQAEGKLIQPPSQIASASASGDVRSWTDIDIKGLTSPSYPTGTYSNVDLAVTEIFISPSYALSSNQLARWPDTETWGGCESRLQHIMRILGVNFAAHWENWIIQSVRQAEAIKDNKITELNNELEFRLKIHKTRLKRINKDLVGVRKKELREHAELVARKIASVIKIIDDARKNFENLTELQNESLKILAEKIAAMEEKMLSATFADRLVIQKREFEAMIDSHISSEIAQLEKLNTDAMCTDLVESNAMFLQSLKSFFNNGSYSDDEVAEFTTQIVILDAKIEAFHAETKEILLQLEMRWKIEEDRIVNNYLEKWQYAESDLDFLENVNRQFRAAVLKIRTEVKATASAKKKLESDINLIRTQIEAQASPSAESIQNSLEVYKSIISESIDRGVQLGIIVPAHDPSVEEFKKRPKEKPKFPKSNVASLVYSKDAATVRYVKNQTYDLLFNESPDAGENLQANIQTYLWNTQTEVVLLTEEYYRKRGNRTNVQGSTVPESIEASYKEIENTLRGYWDKSKDFCASSILEFGKQVELIESVTINFAKFALDALKQNYVSTLESEMKMLNVSSDKIISEWNVASSSIKSRLHGHMALPPFKEKLEQLLKELSTIKEEHKQSLKDLHRETTKAMKQTGKDFIQEVNNLTADLIKSMEIMITPQEINDIKSDGEPAHTGSPKYSPMPSLPETWPGLKNYILPGDSDEMDAGSSFSTTSINTSKKRPQQDIVINYRNENYKAFGEILNSIWAQSNTILKSNISSINDWHAHFITSVNAMKAAVVAYK